MEQVVELFGRYRGRQIALTELTSSLKNVLAREPQAIRQGLGWLDLAQQRNPMPVTEFIQLRADMDFMLRAMALQSGATGAANSSASDSTVFASRSGTTASDKTGFGDFDATLPTRVAVMADNDGTRVAATRIPGADDSTVIAGQKTTISIEAEDATQLARSPVDEDKTQIAAPRSADNDTATLLAAPAIPADDSTVLAPGRTSPMESTTEATVLAAPRPAIEPTVIAPPIPAQTITAPSAGTPPPAPQARQLPQKMPHSQRVPPRAALPADRTAKTAGTISSDAPQRSASLVVALIGGIAAALLLIAGVALWKNQHSANVDNNVEIAPPTQTVNNEPPISNVPSAQPVAATIPASSSSTSLSSDTVRLTLSVENGDEKATSREEAAQASRQPRPAPAEPLPTNADELLTIVKKRIAGGALLPADDPASATYALQALIKLAPNNNATRDARSLLSDAHLALAKKSREKGDLEAAQTHLNDAFDVRLMK